MKADEFFAGVLRQIVDGQGDLYIEIIVVVLLLDTHLAVIRRGVMQVDTQQIAAFIGGKGAHILIEAEGISLKQEHVRYFARKGFGEVAEFHTNLSICQLANLLICHKSRVFWGVVKGRL